VRVQGHWLKKGFYEILQGRWDAQFDQMALQGAFLQPVSPERVMERRHSDRIALCLFTAVARASAHGTSAACQLGTQWDTGQDVQTCPSFFHLILKVPEFRETTYNVCQTYKRCRLHMAAQPNDAHQKLNSREPLLLQGHGVGAIHQSRWRAKDQTILIIIVYRIRRRCKLGILPTHAVPQT